MTTAAQAPSGLGTATGRAFIEVQFPVSKLSKESYKERKANASQTLTALGKWWGRKPLVLVRAILLGLLLPASDEPEKDREVFLKLMTMDDEGLWQRRRGALSPKVVYEQCTARERAEYFAPVNGTPRWKPGLSEAERTGLQRRAFFRLSYDRRLEHCRRPEEVEGPDPGAWTEINAHLGTQVASLPELVRELGERRFGQTPRVGDAFCGGGSIPFEAARLGCEAYGSDLNPVAGLLSWGSLNIVGGGAEAAAAVRRAQERVYGAVREQVDAWGIGRNEEGLIADAYLYCVEVVDPATGWRVPLAPSWVIGEGTRTIARLVPDRANKRFEIEIHQGVTPEEVAEAKTEGTARNGIRCPVDREGNWVSPALRQATSIEQLLGRMGLRAWENDDLVPRPEDIYQERLYCVRWTDPKTGRREYRAVGPADVERETRLLALLRDRFARWQEAGYLPSRRIAPGDKTDEPIRTRGWTHWHHLFNPRQLLIAGLFAERAEQMGLGKLERAGLLLASGRLADWNSRLCRWHPHSANEKPEQTFYNQALNTLANYGSRPIGFLGTNVCVDIRSEPISGSALVEIGDAREIEWQADVWITDPGYADAVNYEELSEFFLAWYDKRLPALFPDWYSDSKRALAVKGTGESFRLAMVDCYRRMASRMPADGFQVVMFTHQDAEVWADLALVLWAAGLRVTAAWTIATETGSTGIRQGNYVQGTVVLVLRKRRGNLRGDMSDLFPEIQSEVQRQLESMLALDPKDDPNFGDADYQLAAYAAALRVLTCYQAIDDIDVERELRRTRARGERSALTPLIQRAVRMASDFLVPDGLERAVWRGLSPEERLYLKGVEIEAAGEMREGVYQEFARGFGVAEYRDLLASGQANRVRLKTPREFGTRMLGGAGFGSSLLRLALLAIQTTAGDAEGDPRQARGMLRQEVADYWNRRQTIIALLRFLGTKPKPEQGMAHWSKDVEAAQVLLGSVENDSL
jgi:adenine-specific DNA methylase